MKLISPWMAVILLGTVLISSSEAQQQKNQQTLQPNTSSLDSVEYLTSPETTSLNLPFAEAVRVGNMLYLSGARQHFWS